MKGQHRKLSPLTVNARKMPTSSPLKSLYIQERADGKRILHVKCSDKTYKSIANFYFKIYGLIEFPLEFQRVNANIFWTLSGAQMELACKWNMTFLNLGSFLT